MCGRTTRRRAKRRQVRRKLFCVLAEHTPSRDCGCANRGTSVVRVVKMRVRSYHLHVQACVRQNCFPRQCGLRSCIAAFPGCVRRDTLRCRVGNRALSVGRAPHVQTRRRDVSTLTRNRRGYATPVTSTHRCSSTATHENPLVELSFDGVDMGAAAPGTTVVRTPEEAKRAVDVLRSLPSDTFHACDTECVDLKLDSQSPVGNGRVTCVSIFSGPDVDFGNGPRLWVDNLDDAEVLLGCCAFIVALRSHVLSSFQGTLDCFKDFFEDTTLRKVWHNYSFDRAVIHNHGIDVHGLGGDTMHMARLWNTARAKNRGYSLEHLTEDLLGRRCVADWPACRRFSCA